MGRFSISAAATAAACFVFAQPAAAANVIANGGFEADTISPWTVSGGISASAFSGHAVIGFNTSSGEATGVLSQTFATASAGLFDYAFDAGRAELFCNCNDVFLAFEARIDGILLSSLVPAYDGSAGGVPQVTKAISHYAGSVMLDAGAHELSFTFARGGSGFGRAPFFVLDGVQGSAAVEGSPPVDAVPEPATWALMILGLGAVGSAMRRRRPALACAVR